MAITNFVVLIGSAFFISVSSGKKWALSMSMPRLETSILESERGASAERLHKMFADKTEANFSDMSSAMGDHDTSVFVKSFHIEPTVEALPRGADAQADVQVVGPQCFRSDSPSLPELVVESAALHSEVEAAISSRQRHPSKFHEEWLDTWFDTLAVDRELDPTVEELVVGSAALHAGIGAPLIDDWTDAWLDNLKIDDHDRELSADNLAANSAALRDELAALSKGWVSEFDVEWTDAWFDTLKSDSDEVASLYTAETTLQELLESSEALKVEVTALPAESQVAKFDVDWLDTWLESLKWR